MLNFRQTLPLLLLGLVTGASAPKSAGNRIVGDYVEARTASVFAGACHYNGELVTTGREAIMAWKITSGSWNGVDLAGVSAVGCVASDANLGDDSAIRKCELSVNTSATPVQAEAMVEAIRARSGEHLGQVELVSPSLIRFTKEGRAYEVNAAGFANLSVRPMPNDECCTQPSMVWYSPLIHLDHRKVGYTQHAAYHAGTNGDTWERSDENSAFYGAFTY